MRQEAEVVAVKEQLLEHSKLEAGEIAAAIASANVGATT